MGASQQDGGSRGSFTGVGGGDEKSSLSADAAKEETFIIKSRGSGGLVASEKMKGQWIIECGPGSEKGGGTTRFLVNGRKVPEDHGSDWETGGGLALGR